MQKATRILHMEDNRNDAELIRHSLQTGGIDCDIRVIDSKEDYIACLEKKDFDLILSDYSIPNFDSVAALEMARKKCPEIPFIYVSGTIGEDRAVEAVLQGATDYVIKDNLKRLTLAVQRALSEAAEKKEKTRLEEMFKQSQKMEAVGRLAGGIAHDFNNVLTSILGCADLIISESDSKTIKADAMEIRQSAQWAASLIRQLLVFSRKQVLEPQLISLNDLVKSMEEMFRRLIGERIEVSYALASGSCRVKVDPSQIKQVLMNLVINARDAMPQGGKLTIETAYVELSELEAAGSYVTVTVTDTGHGMDEEVLAHLFEPFFTTKESGKGTGLGLSTSYGIVKQSGGHIVVSSEKGNGSALKVYLPQAD